MGSINIKAGGTWRPARAFHVHASGAWRPAKEVWVLSGGVWRRAWVNAPEVSIWPLEATSTGYSEANHLPGTTDVTFNVTVSGGTAPYTYQWNYSASVAAPNGSTTAAYFTMRLQATPGTSDSGNVWCVVTDANGVSSQSAMAYYQMDIQTNGGGGVIIES